MKLVDLGRRGDGEAVFEVTDEACGLRAWIAIHDSSNGPAVGGIRRRRYDSDDLAIADAVSLASQMTRKVRFAGLPCGGGKAVILDGPGLDLEAAYSAFGRAVTALRGRYFCGPDVGTGDRELDWVRAHTDFVNSPHNDASASTAAGVLAGIRAVRRVANLPARPRVFIQGVGRVGERVVRGLPDAELVICDPDPARIEAARSAAPGVEVVPADAWESVEADLFVPCAIGPVVTGDNVDRLRFAAICGSANTQLEAPELADALTARGIVYAHDYVVNAGAVIEGVLVTLVGGESARAEAEASIAAIEDRLFALLAGASDSD